MTRDETVALFLESEGKRTQARAAALAESKSGRDAREIAKARLAEAGSWNLEAIPTSFI